MLQHYKVTGRMGYDKKCPRCSGMGTEYDVANIEVVVDAEVDASREEIVDMAEEAFLASDPDNITDAMWAMSIYEIQVESYDLSPAEVMKQSGAKSIFDLYPEMDYINATKHQ